MQYSLSIFIFTLACSLLSANAFAYASDAKSIDFNFFQENISLEYSEEITEILPSFFTTDDIKGFYENLASNLVEPSLEDLLTYRENLELSDWYYYLLIREAASQIFKEKEQPYYQSYQTVFSWLMLAKSGYKVQLNFTEEDVFLSVYTLDFLYDIPIKKHGMGWMVEISHFHTNHEGFRASVRSNFFLDDNTQPFTFKIDKQPIFSKPLLTTRNITFEHNGERYALGYALDSSVLQLITTLPEMNVYDHIDTPLSSFTYHTLIPNLQGFIKANQYDQKETLEFLMSFTRTGFDYKEDQEFENGETSKVQCDNITFTPEETLYYRYSDCEDRSVLLSYLIKELLELDVVLLDYGEHIALGVQLGEEAGEDVYVGKPILYNDRLYTFCEATGPDNSLGLGEYPNNLEEETYVILKYPSDYSNN